MTLHSQTMGTAMASDGSKAISDGSKAISDRSKAAPNGPEPAPHGLADAAPRPLLGALDRGRGPQGDASGTAPAALPQIRRIEALGFRAWPAASSLYDGSWLVRLTAGHPSRRLNSINPLDRMDATNIEARVARLSRRFTSYDRAPVFRRTPLAPAALFAWLDREGWGTEGETRVLLADASAVSTHEALDRVPLGDVGLFVEAALAVRPRDVRYKSGLTEVLSAIRPPKGMFTIREGDEPVATALCVHDGDYAGLFEVAVREDRRGRGLARAITLSAMRWARLHGAERFWCQVEADNAPASRLYDAVGMAEIYRYHYRTAPEIEPAHRAVEELI